MNQASITIHVYADLDILVSIVILRCVLLSTLFVVNCFISGSLYVDIDIGTHTDFIICIRTFYRSIHAQLMETLAQTEHLALLYNKDATSASVYLDGKDSSAKSTLTIVSKSHACLVQFAQT